MPSSSRVDSHRRSLAVAWEKALGGHQSLTGYVGGYCDNSDCDVRQVLMHVDFANAKSVPEIHCPACRSLMLIGDERHLWGNGVMDSDEYHDRRAVEDRDGIVHQLRREQSAFVVWNASDLCRDYSLDDLQEMFRLRAAGHSDPFQGWKEGRNSK